MLQIDIARRFCSNFSSFASVLWMPSWNASAGVVPFVPHPWWVPRRCIRRDRRRAWLLEAALVAFDAGVLVEQGSVQQLDDDIGP
jgi:hypothetical protein